MKNKKQITAVLICILGLSSIGCTSLSAETSETNASEGILNEKEDMAVEVLNSGEEDYEIPNFTEYMGYEFDKLTQEQIIQLKNIYSDIEQLYAEEKPDEMEQKWVELEGLLVEYDFDIPNYNMLVYADNIRHKIKENEYDALIELGEEIEKLVDENSEFMETEEFIKYSDNESKIENIKDEYYEIVESNGININEAQNQIEAANVQKGLYDVKDGLITLSLDSAKSESEITDLEKSLHQEIWKQVKKVIPDTVQEKITKFEINTDGNDGVLAHVVPEDDMMSTWRLAIDIKDSIDSDKNFKSDVNGTLVHELFHIMTLSRNQLEKTANIFSDNYTTDEGTLKTDSYLNKFYKRFWKDIFDEHEETLSINDSEEDGVYEFYEKYADMFVSDYAATNPGEDIAESFSIFILGDKPSGDEIKDQKVKFFYEFDELVKNREDIRKNLGINK